MNELEKKIGVYLSNEEIDCTLDGYRYLQTAIAYTMEHPAATSKLYCDFAASKYNVSAKQVDSSINYALRTKLVRPKRFIHEAAVLLSLQENAV